MKQKFRLRKDEQGMLTIECIPNGYSSGFTTPDGDGTDFKKLIESLKKGDELIIIKK